MKIKEAVLEPRYIGHLLLITGLGRLIMLPVSASLLEVAHLSAFLAGMQFCATLCLRMTLDLTVLALGVLLGDHVRLM